MTIKAVDDCEAYGDLSDYLDWALEEGIWDGRQVSWLEASEFSNETQLRIFELLSREEDALAFERLAAQFAWIGSTHSQQTLLAREIQELDFSKNDLILQVGLKKSCKKFWKKHKKEILIGIAILVVVTVVVVIAVSTGGTGAAAGAGIAAGKALDNACNNEESELPKNITNKSYPDQYLAESPLPSLQLPEPSPSTTQVIFGESGIVFDGRYTSYDTILNNRAEPTLLSSSFPQGETAPSSSAPIDYQMSPNFTTPQAVTGAFDSTSPSTPQDKSWIANFLDTVGRGIIQDSPDLFDPHTPPPSAERSEPFTIPGCKDSRLGIGGINGINTTREGAISHANHLAGFSQGHSIGWTYNRTHGFVVDGLEVLAMNLSGFSPNTSDLLLESWLAFHTENADRPDAKFLQFCHSQGTIHVRNALTKAPQEIRDRVIVQAFGPPIMIPAKLCFRVNHYACKGDVVPYLELTYSAIHANPQTAMIMRARKELIWVEPHPETKSPHDFQNPAFDNIKKRMIEAYIERNGEYE